MKIKLLKDYQEKHYDPSTKHKKGDEIEVTERKAMQLAKGGFCEFGGDEKEVKEKHAKKANRKAKETPEIEND